jgi:aminoglycoside phosphotransferase family enzyme
MLPEPQPFDCIEFNDEYREIDVLDEVAFLCMDLDAFWEKTLPYSCFHYYNHYFSTVRDDMEHQLFINYRAIVPM